MKNILDSIVGFKFLQVIGVFREDSCEKFFTLKLKKNKSQLDILSSEVYADFETLLLSQDLSTPILLLVDGKGILNKKIELKNETDLEWIKNLDYEAIHYTSFYSGSFQYFSFCRQTVSNDIIEKFKKSGFEILDLFVGSVVAALLHSVLKTNKIFSNDSVLDFEIEDLVKISKSFDLKNTVNYDFSEKSISNFHLPLYAAAIHFFVKQKSVSKSEINSINTEELFYKRAFNKLGVVILVGFFFLLLLSYVLTYYYNSKNAQLNLETIYSNQTFELIKNLENQRAKKLEIVTKTGIGSSKYVSFYHYEICKNIPKEVSLISVDVFPLEKEVKVTQEISFQFNHIVVQGSTLDENVFNTWITAIKDYNWIKNLEIVSIKKDKKNITFFELNFTLK